MKALMAVALLALPMADEPAPAPDTPEVTMVATAQFKALLEDNLRLRQLVVDAIAARDKAVDDETTCVVGRTT